MGSKRKTAGKGRTADSITNGMAGKVERADSRAAGAADGPEGGRLFKELGAACFLMPEYVDGARSILDVERLKRETIPPPHAQRMMAQVALSLGSGRERVDLWQLPVFLGDVQIQRDINAIRIHRGEVSVVSPPASDPWGARR